MNIDTLKKLLVHELKDLYSAESQMVDFLPELVRATADKDLRVLLQNHIEETHQQITRLETIFEKFEFEPGGHHCRGMEGLVQEAKEMIEHTEDPELLNAAIISAAQRMEHYEIAGYGSARAYAESLGDHETADCLSQSIEEEGAVDRDLSRLAHRSINFKAAIHSSSAR